jgi:hypothetical protein
MNVRVYVHELLLVGTLMTLQVKFVELLGVMKKRPRADVAKSTVHELLTTVTPLIFSATLQRVCWLLNSLADDKAAYPPSDDVVAYELIPLCVW